MPEVPPTAAFPSRSSCLFSDARWTGALAEYYGFAVERLELGEDRRTSVPYVAFDDLGGARLTALPFSDYLPLSDAAEVAQVAERLRAAYPAASVTLKTRLPAEAAPRGAEVVRRAVLHVIPAGGEGPNAKFRANGRRAERDGVSVRRVVERGALERFYELFASLRVAKFASIPQPLGFFAAVYDAFVAAGSGYFLEALYRDEVIASFFILESGGRAYYKFSASSLDTLVPRPNNLLFRWLHEALDRGEYDAIDLGISGAGEAYEGLRYFKRTAGGVETPVTYLRWRPEGYDDSVARAHLRSLGAIVERLVAAELSPRQLSEVSAAIYPHFA